MEGNSGTSEVRSLLHFSGTVMTGPGYIRVTLRKGFFESHMSVECRFSGVHKIVKKVSEFGIAYDAGDMNKSVTTSFSCFCNRFYLLEKRRKERNDRIYN